MRLRFLVFALTVFSLPFDAGGLEKQKSEEEVLIGNFLLEMEQRAGLSKDPSQASKSQAFKKEIIARGPQIVPTLLANIPPFKKRFQSPSTFSTELNNEVCSALAQMRPTTQEVVDGMLSRWGACEGLLDQMGAMAAPFTKESLQSGREKEIRWRAALALAKIDGKIPAVKPNLQEAMRNAEDLDDLRGAAAALEMLDEESAVSILQEIALDKSRDKGLRYAAIGLLKLKGPKASAASKTITSLLKDKTLVRNDVDKMFIAEALKATNDPKAISDAENFAKGLELKRRRGIDWALDENLRFTNSLFFRSFLFGTLVLIILLGWKIRWQSLVIDSLALHVFSYIGLLAIFFIFYVYETRMADTSAVGVVWVSIVSNLFLRLANRSLPALVAIFSLDFIFVLLTLAVYRWAESVPSGGVISVGIFLIPFYIADGFALAVTIGALWNALKRNHWLTTRLPG